MPICSAIALGREPGGGLVVSNTFTHRAPIISAAARNKVPAVYSASEFVRDGGLLFYTADGADARRRAASYVDRILRVEKPCDLPVQLPTRFELIINLRTARALLPGFLGRRPAAGPVDANPVRAHGVAPRSGRSKRSTRAPTVPMQ